MRSVQVAVITLVISLAIGVPAGYAIARFAFRGADAFRLTIVSTRAFPIVILAIPLSVTFIRWGIDDSVLGVAIAHTALALPFAVLTTSSVFAGISEEYEEAAMTLGCSRLTAVWKVILPLALPGLAAAAIFVFIISWNDVFAASVLTLRHRTLPAQVLTASERGAAPVPRRRRFLPARAVADRHLLHPQVPVQHVGQGDEVDGRRPLRARQQDLRQGHRDERRRA